MSNRENSIDLLKEKLRKIVSDSGDFFIYNDLDNLKEKMNKENIKKCDLYALLMILDCADIKNYLHRDSVSMIDVNNIVTDISEKCGFKRAQAQYYLSAIFYSVGFTIDIDSLYPMARKNSATMLETLDISKTDYEQTIKYLEGEIERKSDSFTSNSSVVEIFEKLVKANNDKALYLKGKCYYYGIGTQPDVEKAREYFQRSAELGNIRAEAFLGDVYYDKQLFSNAYNYYTRIGVVALSKERQEKVKTILKFKGVNLKVKITVVLTYMLSMILAFMTMLGGYCAEGCTHFPSGVILVLLLTACLGLTMFYSSKNKYDNVKLSMLIMVLLDLFFSITAYVIK